MAYGFTLIPEVESSQEGSENMGRSAQFKQTTKPTLKPRCLLAGVVFIILCWTFISFYPSVNCGFVNWDDSLYVKENTVIQQNSIPFKEIFTTSLVSNYHPLTMLSFALNYQSSGLNPAAYHWTNVITHLLNTLLVFVFIYLLDNKTIWIAAMVSLLFGIHPMHVESVTWVSGRKDVLYTFFYLDALIVYLKYLETPNVLIYAAVFVLFILSCLSKGVAVTLPVIMLMIDYFKDRRITWKVLLEKVPFIVFSMIFGIAAVSIQSRSALADDKVFTLFERLMFASYGFIMYIFKMFLPYSLCAFYGYPTINDKEGLPSIYYLAPFIVICTFLLGAWSLKRSKVFIFGLLFYFISVALVLQFMTVGRAIMAERYAYLSYVGLLFTVSSGCIYLLEQKPSMKFIIPSGVIVYAFIFSYMTLARTQIWKNSITLWDDVINKRQDIDIAYQNRAAAKNDIGDYRGALEDCNKAINLNSAFPVTYGNRSYSKAKLGDFKGAISDLDMFFKIIPSNRRIYYRDRYFWKMYYSRGLYKEKINDYRGAIEDYSAAIELNRTNAQTFINRAKVKDTLLDYKSSILDLDKAIQLNPANIMTYEIRGVVKGKAGDFEGAIADFSKSIALKPEDTGAYANRAIAYLRINKIKNACEDWYKAARFGNMQAKGMIAKTCT